MKPLRIRRILGKISPDKYIVKTRRKLKMLLHPYKLGICRGAWKLSVRDLLPTQFQFPVTLISPQDIKFRISLDPVDVKVLRSVLVTKRQFYFPKIPIPLPNHPLILDIGAHNGFYALATLATYPNSRIICVEPSHTAISRLYKNLELNGWLERARLVNAALADHSGKGRLKICIRGSYGNSLYETEDQTIDVEETTLKPLDEILNGDKPHIIKCNAEGGEYELVKQLQVLDIRPLLLIIMIHQEFGNMQSLIKSMQRLGYRYALMGSSKRPVAHFWHKALPPTSM